MTEAIAIAKLKTLTLQHQQEVLDFIEFLKTKEQRQASEATQSVSGDASKQIDPEAATDWQAEPFFGIWRDQEDMKDSTAWVRQLRQEQWNG